MTGALRARRRIARSAPGTSSRGPTRRRSPRRPSTGGPPRHPVGDVLGREAAREGSTPGWAGMSSSRLVGDRDPRPAPGGRGRGRRPGSRGADARGPRPARHRAGSPSAADSGTGQPERLDDPEPGQPGQALDGLRPVQLDQVEADGPRGDLDDLRGRDGRRRGRRAWRGPSSDAAIAAARAGVDVSGRAGMEVEADPVDPGGDARDPASAGVVIPQTLIFTGRGSGEGEAGEPGRQATPSLLRRCGTSPRG